MKLYYSPGACSLSPHIALLEAGLPYDLVKVDLRAKKLENGDDYLAVNPKGQVPALALDSGELVTEGPVIVQMIADKAGKGLAPARDSDERYKLQAWLTYINSELHKNIGPQFSPVLADDAKAFFKDRAMGKFKYVDGELAGKDYLMGKQFTVAGRLHVHDAVLGRADEVGSLRHVQPDGLQSPRRRPPEGAGSARQGRPDERGVSFSLSEIREGRINDPALSYFSPFRRPCERRDP